MIALNTPSLILSIWHNISGYPGHACSRILNLIPCFILDIKKTGYPFFINGRFPLISFQALPPVGLLLADLAELLLDFYLGIYRISGAFLCPVSGRLCY